MSRNLRPRQATRHALRPMVHRLEGRSLLTVDLTLLPPPTPAAGQDFTANLGSFTFTDGSIGDYKASIDWGDGTVDAGVITANSNGSGTIRGEHTYYHSGDEPIAVEVDNGNDGSEGATAISVGAGSGSGSGPGPGFGPYSGNSSSPSNLSYDISLVSQGGSPSVVLDQSPWTGLLLNGGTPWDDLRPSNFTSQPYSSNTSTATNGGLTTTLTTAGSVTASVSGSGNGSGGSSGSGNPGGSWDESYEQTTTYKQTITGTDANGMTVNDSVSFTYDLNWHAWGDGGGTTNYKVTEDVTRSTVDDTSGGSGGSYDLNTQDTFDGHLMAEGVVASSNTLTSGDFTYKMDGGAKFSLTDGSGTPSGSSPGYSVNYLSSEDMTLNDSGSLIPDSTNQGTNTVTETKNGQVAGFDGAGGSASIGFGESVQAIDNYQASQAPAGQSNSPPPSGPTSISMSGPKTQVPIGNGKNTVYVIDVQDPGDPSDSTIASGQSIKNALRPAAEDLIDARSVALAVKGLGKALSTKGGKADVLVIGDHGLVR